MISEKELRFVINVKKLIEWQKYQVSTSEESLAKYFYDVLIPIVIENNLTHITVSELESELNNFRTQEKYDISNKIFSLNSIHSLIVDDILIDKNVIAYEFLLKILKQNAKFTNSHLLSLMGDFR